MDDIKRILAVTKSTKQCKKAVHHFAVRTAASSPFCPARRRPKALTPVAAVSPLAYRIAEIITVRRN